MTVYVKKLQYISNKKRLMQPATIKNTVCWSSNVIFYRAYSYLKSTISLITTESRRKVQVTSNWSKLRAGVKLIQKVATQLTSLYLHWQVTQSNLHSSSAFPRVTLATESAKNTCDFWWRRVLSFLRYIGRCFGRHHFTILVIPESVQINQNTQNCVTLLTRNK